MTYYFIGIKGSGMSALACIMHDLGYKVEGSDKSEYFFTEDELKKRNIKINVFDKNNIKDNMIIIKGNAFNDENEEVLKSKELNLKIYSYQEMINEVTKNNILIAISGCHGKTTTTTILSHIFKNLGINYLIGDGSGKASKNNSYFALEACEYKRHFLSYYPTYSIITNIGLDHIDYYKDLDDVINAFNNFANQTKKYIIACGDNINVRKLNTTTPILFYGFNENNDIVAKNIKIKDDKSTIDVYIKNKHYITLTLPFTLDHLILNSLAVIGICYLEKISKIEIKKQFLTVPNAKRRFVVETFKDNIIIDDYAHHPTELKVTINAARKKYPNKKIIAIFKAHTKSRVKYFYKDFADALNLADKSYVMEIGEDRIEKGYEDINENLIIKNTKNCEFISLDTADKLLKYKNSVLLFMSSKDIYHLINKYKKLAK